MVLNVSDQAKIKVKECKLFDTCKFIGKWKHVDDCLPACYVALEDGVAIELRMIQADIVESLRFKKSSKIIIKDSVMEFYEEDLFR